MKTQRGMLLIVRDVLSVMSMERISFGRSNRQLGSAPVKMDNGDPVTEGNVDDFIRERTQLWRQTWVISPLEEIKEGLEGTLKHEFVLDPSYVGYDRCRLCNQQRIHKLHW